MKKLGKITINPEKVIKNEELINLRGGYGEGPCKKYCWAGMELIEIIGVPYCHYPDSLCPSGTTWTHCIC